MENVKIANKIYIISGEFNLCLNFYATNICPHMITVVIDKLIKTLKKPMFFYRRFKFEFKRNYKFKLWIINIYIVVVQEYYLLIYI